MHNRVTGDRSGGDPTGRGVMAAKAWSQPAVSVRAQGGVGSDWVWGTGHGSVGRGGVLGVARSFRALKYWLKPHPRTAPL